MNDEVRQPFPKNYVDINRATMENGFSMPSDIHACSLLKTLATSKLGGDFLELGTGTGLSTSWILDGMDSSSTLTSIDNDPELLSIAKSFLGNDKRLNLIQYDGGQWISENIDQTFDYIFADTWHGKYLLLEETLSMLRSGGLYIIDDMIPQSNWPVNHAEKVTDLISSLESKTNLTLTKLSWSTGVIVAVKN